MNDRVRRGIAYAIIVIAGAVGLYEVGPAQQHRQCVSANASRREVKDEIEFVLRTFGAPESKIAELHRAQEKNLPQRHC